MRPTQFLKHFVFEDVTLKLDFVLKTKRLDLVSVNIVFFLKVRCVTHQDETTIYH